MITVSLVLICLASALMGVGLWREIGKCVEVKMPDERYFDK